jgi:hypothetical protein
VKDVRYINHSASALVQLAARLAPLVERGAEITVEEIQAQLDAGGGGGAEYTYIADMDREDWRRTADPAADGVKYRASAPGEAPAQPTKKYRNSWHATEAGRRGSVLAALAFSKAKTSDGRSLAADLEYGGANAPRPHIRPALVRARVRIAALVRQATGR